MKTKSEVKVKKTKSDFSMVCLGKSSFNLVPIKVCLLKINGK